MLFTGHFTHSMDAKGRVSIPKEYLEAIPDSGTGRLLMGTRGFDHCFYLMVPEDWQVLQAKVQEASIGDPEVRRFSRIFFSSPRKLPVDASGRILLPLEYRESLGMDSDHREVQFLGVGNRIELWSPRDFAAEAETADPEYDKQAAKIF